MPKRQWLTPDKAVIAGSILLIIIGTLPVLFKYPPAPSFKLFSQAPALGLMAKILMGICFIAMLFLIDKLSSTQTPNKFFFYSGFLVLSFLLTELHFYITDIYRLKWQADQYIRILAGTYGPPHQYRFLPQGILWWLCLFSGDFLFSYLSYRFLFTFAVCLSLYKLSRLYNSHKDSLIVVLGYAVFYPLSILYYYGNLLDPMFHGVFILILIYCRNKKFWQVFFLLALGMFIKETVILAIPCYYLLNIESLRLIGKKVFLQMFCLFIACLFLFLLCRIPFDFRYTLEGLNGTEQLMILSNLGFSGGMAQSTVSVFARYLHPVLFIFIWVPILIYKRKFLSRSLFCTSMYLAVSIYLTNLCFGWNYESRNFIPALSMLLVSTAAVFNQKTNQAGENTPTIKQEDLH